MQVHPLTDVPPQHVNLRSNTARCEQRQGHDGENMAKVPKNRGLGGLERAFPQNCWEKCEDDVDGRKDGDDHKDNVRDFVIDGE